MMVGVSDSSSLLAPPSIFKYFFYFSSIPCLHFLRGAGVTTGTVVRATDGMNVVVEDYLPRTSIFYSIFSSNASSSSMGPMSSPSRATSALSLSI